MRKEDVINGVDCPLDVDVVVEQTFVAQGIGQTLGCRSRTNFVAPQKIGGSDLAHGALFGNGDKVAPLLDGQHLPVLQVDGFALLHELLTGDFDLTDANMLLSISENRMAELLCIIGVAARPVENKVNGFVVYLTILFVE